MADTNIYNPREEGEIFAPSPVDPAAQVRTPEPEVPVMGGGWAGYNVQPPSGPVEGPYSKPISDMMIDIEANKILEAQGLDPMGRPMETMQMFGPGGRQRFIDSYFQENGNPLAINVAQETDRLLGESMDRLWNSFFGGRVPMNGRLTNKQAQEWNKFLEAVYADTYNRVQADKNEQTQHFKFALGEFGLEEERAYNETREYRDRQRRAMEMEAGKDREMEQWVAKEEYKAEHKKTTAAEIKGELLQKFLAGNATEDELRVIGMDKSSQTLRALTGLMGANPRFGMAITSQSKPTQAEIIKNGWDSSQVMNVTIDRTLEKINELTRDFDAALRSGKPVSEIKAMRIMNEYQEKMDNVEKKLSGDQQLKDVLTKATTDKERGIALKAHLLKIGMSEAQANEFIQYIEKKYSTEGK